MMPAERSRAGFAGRRSQDVSAGPGRAGANHVSEHELAAVDVDDLAGDEAAAVAAEVDAGGGDIVGPAEVLDGQPVADGVGVDVAVLLGVPLRGDGTGGDGVGGDV